MQTSFTCQLSERGKFVSYKWNWYLEFSHSQCNPSQNVPRTVLTLQTVKVQSLPGELKSCKPGRVAKKKNKTKKKSTPTKRSCLLHGVSKEFRSETMKKYLKLSGRTKRTEGEWKSQRGKGLEKEVLASLHLSPSPLWPTESYKECTHRPLLMHVGHSSQIHRAGSGRTPQLRGGPDPQPEKTYCSQTSFF